MREKIPEILVKLEDKDYQTNWQEEVKIARETIDENMIEQASIYGWYGVLAAMVDDVAGNKKLDLAVLEAELYDEHRKKALETPGSKVTEGAINSMIKQDERFIAATLDVLTAKKNKNVFDAIVRSFEQRKEMLINLGAKYRKEMDGDVVFKK